MVNKKEEKYSTPLLDHYFEEMNIRMDKQDKSLQELVEGVKFQNGRVTKIEAWINEAKAVIEKTLITTQEYRVDKGSFKTSLAVISAVAVTIISLAYMVLNYQMQSKIDTASRDQASSFQIKLDNQALLYEQKIDTAMSNVADEVLQKLEETYNLNIKR